MILTRVLLAGWGAGSHDYGVRGIRSCELIFMHLYLFYTECLKLFMSKYMLFVMIRRMRVCKDKLGRVILCA